MDWTLERSHRFAPRQGPVVIVVMDGVGLGREDEGNAVWLARKPTLDRLMARHPWTKLRAHGTAVGLPSDDDMGNSEVGHNAIGAGRVFAQGARLVNEAVASGSLWTGKGWRALMERCGGADGGALHFIGLLSDGNVHSHIDQLFALLDRASEEGVRRVRVHPLLDGRDVEEISAFRYIDALEAKLASLGAGADRDYRIASGGGRMVTTMDRYEADWAIVARGWRAHVHGDAERFQSAREAVQTFYDRDADATDQFLPQFVVAEGGEPVGAMRDGDGVVFFNFRGDRAIEISRAFEEGEEFAAFDRGRVPDVLYAGIMEYDGDFHIPRTFLVDPPHIQRTMGEYLAHNGVRQFACSETQKFGHVTYFWNGNRGGKFDEALERYVEIPSDRVPFEQRPWMKAAEITDEALRAIAEGFPFIRINYPNGDMVGHSGVRQAAIVAVEAVDLSLGRLLRAVADAKGVALVLADHGNADEMYEWSAKKGDFKRGPDGGPIVKTAHTLNPVPFLLYDPAPGSTLGLRTDVPAPGLANVAATTLNLLGFEAPQDYEPSLVDC